MPVAGLALLVQSIIGYRWHVFAHVERGVIENYRRCRPNSRENGTPYFVRELCRIPLKGL